MHSPSAEFREKRATLMLRIATRYDVTTQNVEIGPISFPFTRVKDPDKVLDEIAAEESRLEKLSGAPVPEDRLHLPYWAALWDSGEGIAQHVVKDTIRARRILNTLDLGCGMGFAGTAAAAMGHRVLFADLEPHALLFAQLNSLPFAARVRTRQLNWQRHALNETFDLILGADILYEKKQWPFLERFWRAHLSRGGTVLLGEPGRQTGDLFMEWIEKHGGWALTQHEEAATTRPIRLFELRLDKKKPPSNVGG